jgi:hypothetical protein
MFTWLSLSYKKAFNISFSFFFFKGYIEEESLIPSNHGMKRAPLSSIEWSSINLEYCLIRACLVIILLTENNNK